MPRSKTDDGAETPAPRFRTLALSHRKPTRFHWTAGPLALATFAKSLGLLRVKTVDVAGELRPEGRHDFRLEARLRADVIQACVVTLAPVPAAIDEAITRQYQADYAEPDADEVEIPEDDTTEALPEVIDLMDVLQEALALALPLYPRAPGAELGEAVFAAPGEQPLREADLRPFAGLARLVAKTDPEQG